MMHQSQRKKTTVSGFTLLDCLDKHVNAFNQPRTCPEAFLNSIVLTIEEGTGVRGVSLNYRMLYTQLS